MTKFCAAALQEHAAALLAHKQEMQQLSSAQRESLDGLNRQHMSALQRRRAQIQSLTEQHQAQLDALNRHVSVPLHQTTYHSSTPCRSPLRLLPA